MSSLIRLRKGLDIRLKGKAEKILMSEISVSRYCIRPTDFPGLVPKLEVKEGDIVSAGTPLFHDKKSPQIRYTSPVSGKISEIQRGDKRLLLGVVIEQEGKERIDFVAGDPKQLTADEIREKLLISGLWPVIRQRPYNIVADPDKRPKSVFISAFNTAPLEADVDYVLSNIHGKYMQTAVDAISKLSDGPVHVTLSGEGTRNQELKKLEGVQYHYFAGPHPAANVGVQIHHIDPVNKGEVVWFINIQDLVAIGRLFQEGYYEHDRIIALAGTGVIKPRYYRSRVGASLSSILASNLQNNEMRVISGNVLTGDAVGMDGYLGFYSDMVTVIPEGKYNELFGWVTPGFKKHSFWRTFMSKLIPMKEYDLDTNFHGGRRPFVVTGHYERVFPMDIYPIHLLKAILAEDIELMENLGIYEVAEEDFALCEYIDPSKTEMQELVRKGIDLMIKEMN